MKVIALEEPSSTTAHLSHRQAKDLGLTTSGTFGPPGTGSSTSADLSLSLASKLVPVTASLGSTLFKLTWKARVTPSGYSIPALRASARPTSGSGSTSWPTPDARTGRGGVCSDPNDPIRRRERGNQLLLESEVLLATWPTPRAEERQQHNSADNYVALSKAVEMASWPTPRQGGDGGTAEHSDLSGVADLALWATPTARDWRSEQASSRFNKKRWNHPRGKPLSAEAALVQLTVSGETPSGSTAETANTARLNPALPRWLQGLPPEWDVAAILAHRSMPTTRRKRE